jgi:hypothetical protein
MRTHLALNKDALTSPDVLRAPREGRAAALLRNVMNSRRLIAAPEAQDKAPTGPTYHNPDEASSGKALSGRRCPLWVISGHSGRQQ